MKVYLLTKEGAIREHEVFPPFPDVIRMAKASAVQILNPKDMMADELTHFPIVSFRLKKTYNVFASAGTALTNYQSGTDKTAVYIEDGYAEYQQQKILQQQAFEAQDIQSAMYKQLLSQHQQMLAQQQPGLPLNYGGPTAPWTSQHTSLAPVELLQKSDEPLPPPPPEKKIEIPPPIEPKKRYMAK